MTESLQQLQTLNFTASSKDFQTGVAIVLSAVSRRNTMPILGHILIETLPETGQVQLSATDLEMWIRHTLPMPVAIAIPPPAKATVPGRSVSDLLGTLDDGLLSFASVQSMEKEAAYTTHLKSGKAKFKLLSLDPEMFPNMPELADGAISLSVDRAELREALKCVIFAVSSDETRMTLTGVLFRIDGGELKLAATDTHRLAVKKLRITDFIGDDRECIMPENATAELVKILGSKDEGTVRVRISESQIHFFVSNVVTGSSTTLISRLIEGKYPDYERVLPRKKDLEIFVERDHLIAALKRAEIIAGEKGSANRVNARFDYVDEATGTISLFAVSDVVGTSEESVETQYKIGDQVSLLWAFNVNYMIEVMNTIASDHVYLEMQEPLKPFVVRPTDDDSYFCVVMPMQTV